MPEPSFVRRRRVTPREEIARRLAERIPADLLPLVPRKWERLGRVVLLRVPPELAPHDADVGAAFAEVLGVDTVLADEGGVAGEFREMVRTRFLHGDDGDAVHRENGILFHLDASRLMFSSGNVTERTHMAGVDAAGETVVDLFGGIGYFTLPLAVHAGAARVIACEKNPLAHRYLVRNVEANRVADVVEVRLGDNREVAPQGVADRVVMGYFPGTAAFLPTALAALKPEGGVIHYHETAPAVSARDDLAAEVIAACQEAGRPAAVTGFRRVKNYAPGIVHAVVDVEVGA